MGFLPANFQLATPFHSQFRVRHGTDTWTERQWASVHDDHPMGQGIIKSNQSTYAQPNTQSKPHQN